MKWMRCLIAVLAVMFLGSDVFADDPGKWYLAARAGTYSPSTSDNGLINKLDSGMTGEVGVGYFVSQNLAIEAGFAGFNAERTLPAADVAASTVRSLSTTAFLLTVRGVLPLANDKVELSAGGGIGSYKLDIEIKDPPPPPADHSESATETGFHVIAGIAYNITQRIALGLEYRWFSVDADGTDLGGDAVTLGVRYRF